MAGRIRDPVAPVNDRSMQVNSRRLLPRRGLETVFRKLVSLVIVVVAAGLVPGQARAVELGLTPSNVFSLWTNVNNALIAVAGASSRSAGWTKGVETTARVGFEGKNPGDVLERVAAFRDKLDRLRRTSGLSATRRYREDSGTVTPSVVFLNSGYVLDSVVEWLIESTGREQLVSPFYTRHDFSAKTPNDVFGLVDLANRRIDIILVNSNI